MPIICIIAAVAENGVIGRDGKMPWHLPAELKYFRARTIGKPVIMGRKTFQSIGKPLPGRDNIVITRDQNITAVGARVAASLGEALDLARQSAASSGAAEIMIIGGAEIYAQTMPLASRIYLSRIDARPDGDATFPTLLDSEWRLISEAPIPREGAATADARALIYDRIVDTIRG